MVCKPAMKKVPTNKRSEFSLVFDDLKTVLAPHVKTFRVAQDTPSHSCLETNGPAYKGKPLMFAAVRAGKAYVSYHLFPLYMNEKLVSTISPELKRRMQGKTCFNFTRTDPALFAELGELTATSIESFKAISAKLQSGSFDPRRKP